MQPETPLLIVGLGTFKRPNMLRETLSTLRDLRAPQGYRIKLVLADNDPEMSAKAVMDEFEGTMNLPTHYVLAEKRGIVYMRNTIVEYALDEKASLLAFIDDDELVEPNWLEVMLREMHNHKADVVVGRVERILPEKTPKWILKGDFFERPNIPTGAIRKAASTSNVIFDLNLLCVQMGLRFHPALNLSGSSDTFLFSEASQKGAKIVWVNENLIKESIPASRMTVDWLLKRAFRHNNCRTIRARIKYSYIRVLLSEGAYGIAHFVLAVFFFPFYIFLGKAGLVHILRFLWKGAGSFAGLSGYVYKEYSHVHGN